MGRIDGRAPDGAAEVTTGQANRVWYIDGGGRGPYVLKHYSVPARADNKAATLALLTHHPGSASTAPTNSASGPRRTTRSSTSTSPRCASRAWPPPVSARLPES
ncbi:hypothetical protein [Streptomyces antibioticus]|uniref:hypothetical protein n=1 Tax=Streptomyces antibioticus TaxID=1890 RepID=UPI0033A76803